MDLHPRIQVLPMNNDQTLMDLIRGGDYTEEHRRAAIESGMREHFGLSKKVAGIEGFLKASPYLLLIPPVAAAIAGDLTGRAHHRIELAASKRRDQSLASTRERLRAITEIAEARGGFAIPGEDIGGGGVQRTPAPMQSSPRVEDRVRPPAGEKTDSGKLIELLD